MFINTYKRWNFTGEHHNECNCIGQKRVDAQPLILGCLQIKAKGTTFNLIDEGTNVSFQHMHSFFHKSVGWFVAECKDKWIKMPSTAKETHHMEGYCRQLGLPGCIGSVDCVNVGWDVCLAGCRSNCEGKEGHLMLAFEAVLLHTHKFLSVITKFFGAWNNETMSQCNKFMQAWHGNDLCKNMHDNTTTKTEIT